MLVDSTNKIAIVLKKGDSSKILQLLELKLLNKNEHLVDVLDSSPPLNDLIKCEIIVVCKFSSTLSMVCDSKKRTNLHLRMLFSSYSNY